MALNIDAANNRMYISMMNAASLGMAAGSASVMAGIMTASDHDTTIRCQLVASASIAATMFINTLADTFVTRVPMFRQLLPDLPVDEKKVKAFKVLSSGMILGGVAAFSINPASAALVSCAVTLGGCGGSAIALPMITKQGKSPIGIGTQIYGAAIMGVGILAAAPTLTAAVTTAAVALPAFALLNKVYSWL